MQNGHEGKFAKSASKLYSFNHVITNAQKRQSFLTYLSFEYFCLLCLYMYNLWVARTYKVIISVGLKQKHFFSVLLCLYYGHTLCFIMCSAYFLCACISLVKTTVTVNSVLLTAASHVGTSGFLHVKQNSLNLQYFLVIFHFFFLIPSCLYVQNVYFTVHRLTKSV